MHVLIDFDKKYPNTKLENEFVFFQTMATDSYDVFSREPIRSVEDFKGKKVRINGKSERPFVEALGAVPVSIPVEDIYEAFDKGMRSEEHTSELQSRGQLVCSLLLEKKKQKIKQRH